MNPLYPKASKKFCKDVLNYLTDLFIENKKKAEIIEKDSGTFHIYESGWYVGQLKVGGYTVKITEWLPAQPYKQIEYVLKERYNDTSGVMEFYVKQYEQKLDLLKEVFKKNPLLVENTSCLENFAYALKKLNVHTAYEFYELAKKSPKNREMFCHSLEMYPDELEKILAKLEKEEFGQYVTGLLNEII